MNSPILEELEYYYKTYFSLGSLATDIGNKFALISLICFLTKQARNKDPYASPWQVLNKIRPEGQSSPLLIRAVAIMCTDFMRNTNEFLTFDLKSSKDMVSKINQILDTELPWESEEDDLPF